jgi:hypothetical protein
MTPTTTTYIVSDREWRFFQDVAVPACLGNTAWAFVTILLRDGVPYETFPQCATLILLTAFLIGDWHGGVQPPTITDKRFTLASAVFYVAVAAYSISAVETSGVAALPVVLTFAVVGLGHLLGAWTRKEESGPEVPTGQKQDKDRWRRFLWIASLVCATVCGLLAWLPARLMPPDVFGKGRQWYFNWLSVALLGVIVAVWRRFVTSAPKR